MISLLVEWNLWVSFTNKTATLKVSRLFWGFVFTLNNCMFHWYILQHKLTSYQQTICLLHCIRTKESFLTWQRGLLVSVEKHTMFNFHFYIFTFMHWCLFVWKWKAFFSPAEWVLFRFIKRTNRREQIGGFILKPLFLPEINIDSCIIAQQFHLSDGSVILHLHLVAAKHYSMWFILSYPQLGY